MVDALGEQAGEHRGVGRIGMTLPSAGERERDVPAALEIRGPLRNDLEDALIFRWIVDRRKGPGAGRDTQIAEQAVGAEAGEPHPEQGGERGAPERQQLDLRTRRILGQRGESLLPVRANVRRRRLDHWLTSRPSK